MKIFKFFSFAIIAFTLTACTEPAPVVSDFNGDSVKIQESTLLTGANPEEPEVVNQASRICGTRGRKAEYVSTTYAPNNYYASHLFLCL
ncbi:hypothetical protein [Pseudooceanicola algae]|uniref:Lipoprotein n=1 Tax=Pseudooceanicola algae TaxID=1537215 RepID=A0A418SDG9_9RHOB|nr:hypothetical protein [Pseudooceanicola algae]QPM89360.1 hypothetical protein PSAL_005760 [Pseudooceanicola algae]